VALAALLGASVAMIPALSGFASGGTVSASESGCGSQPYCWSPSSESATAGGTVTFRNPSEGVPHGISWTGGPETPACSGVPINEFKVKWEGTCKFAKPGEYTFICPLHTYMTGKITVSGGTTTTSSSTTTTTTKTSTTTTSTSTHTTAHEPSGEESAFAGGPNKAIVLRSSQRGTSVRGSVTVSKAGAGGRLEVDLLAASASLTKSKGKHKHSSSVRVGRLVRGSVHAGKTSFSVSLTSKAKSALRRHHHLALTVKITLTPSGGSAATATRRVALHG
jgi:plastocyanin